MSALEGVQCTEGSSSVHGGGNISIIVEHCNALMISPHTNHEILSNALHSCYTGCKFCKVVGTKYVLSIYQILSQLDL